MAGGVASEEFEVSVDDAVLAGDVFPKEVSYKLRKRRGGNDQVKNLERRRAAPGLRWAMALFVFCTIALAVLIYNNQKEHNAQPAIMARPSGE